MDETGQPVPGAEVRIGFSTASAQGGPVPDKITGRTDTNGMFVTTHVDRSVQLDFSAQKAGYYAFAVQHFLGFSEKDRPDWNPSPTLTLKAIRNPIPMYAKRIDNGPPVFNKPLGYDLMAGDWVAPHGNGVSTDIVFTKTSRLKSSTDYESTLTVSFPNKGDGIQKFEVPFHVDEGSTLRSPHEAPEADYQSALTRETSAHPGQPSKFDYDETRNYFFRVRTVLDGRGNVKSALYGKIYGDFMRVCYYLNPTANDRNVEFDVKQNLLRGELVYAP
jgi:hypothetical protein